MKAMPRAAPGSVLPGVQILRAVAAIAVLVHHVPEETYGLAGVKIPAFITLLGSSGVDLFFVVSGFIIVHTTRSRFGKKGAAREFAVRRLIRVVPLYWLCTLLMVGLHSTGLFYRNLTVTPYSVADSLLFLPSDSAILFVGWTLKYEMYFYAVFFLLMCFLTTSMLVAVFPLVIGSVLLVSSWMPDSPERVFFSNPIALEFSFGMIVAVIYARTVQRRRFADAALLFGSLGLVVGAILAPSVGSGGLDPSVRFLIWGMPSTALLWCALGVRVVNGAIGKAFMHFGDASYSIYLTHAIVISGYARVLKAGLASDLPAVFPILAAVALSLGVGSASYRLVERPIDRWLKAAWRSRRRRPEVLNTGRPAAGAATASLAKT